MRYFTSKGLITLALLTISPITPAQFNTAPLRCELTDTADYFLFYQDQLVYQSDQFAIFQNFKGRVSSQVDLKTGELVRTTYIGEPFEPKIQILYGHCMNPQSTLKMWEMSKVPYND
ncbi:hypothetical protein [Vibrio sp. V39_P1S14PM300]|uniref:hypothetical protein n=1 Tax=Vibrio sp. V39_P1S14PM300 TaxID=1938690 RepID=UPI001372C200|nr:hypothetical protein [Vibrio sp. V39_P1S14PM300]NAX21655.1 hypothetical protein [Vibrio sp. V39_P1S14PM300]